MTKPIPGGFGEWIQKNSSLTPRHGSHIAAVLKEFGIIKDTFGKKPIILKFSRLITKNWSGNDPNVAGPQLNRYANDQMSKQVIENNINEIIDTIQLTLNVKKHLPTLILIFSAIDVLAWLNLPHANADVTRKGKEGDVREIWKFDCLDPHHNSKHIRIESVVITNCSQSSDHGTISVFSLI